ncbi:uncharacterized protein [Aegilops tauschii subsp. strangulata]|uniref:uncharacterized protein n=1 Tax=Aegilops tauschii subsp. strangulata TaxID=200361 RepID=UPI00098BC554
MVSWNDGETSDSSISLPSYESEPYIPRITVDPEWCGIVSGGLICSHKTPVERGVAFQSTHTGRRFFGCSEQGGYSCGLVEWVDPEWPEPLKNALRKLWNMYEQTQEQIKVKEDVIALLEEEKRLMQAKQKSVQESAADQVAPDANEIKTDLEKENMSLKGEVELLKKIQASQAELISKWRKDAHVDEVNQQKKRLEFAISDLFKDGEANKSKLKRIKAICDE